MFQLHCNSIRQNVKVVLHRNCLTIQKIHSHILSLQKYNKINNYNYIIMFIIIVYEFSV